MRTAVDRQRPDLRWTDSDRAAVGVCRALAMDAVEAAGSGHPGTAMSLAPAAYVLFSRLLRHDPSDPTWPGRDRFVLSCGHASMTLYAQLYLSGYDLRLEDLQNLRQWGSPTPGHPEHGHTDGVEVTTGPLGQGVANAVGMAMAARRTRGLLDPDASPGNSPFDHTVWVFASDGDLQEGVSGEASSLAGHQKLGNLVLLWDDNHISIEGDTAIATSEDVAARYAAYGWHVQHVEDAEDVTAVHEALLAAREETTRPSFIRMRSVIAHPAPHAGNTAAAHGSALGTEEVAATKVVLGLDPTKSFDVPAQVLEHTREATERGCRLRELWQQGHDSWAAKYPDRKALHDRLTAGALPEEWSRTLPSFAPCGTGMATRQASGLVLSALASTLPELWGGSADLAGSNNTTMEGASSFLPAGSDHPDADPYGRTLHFGIREHAMAAVMNGIALHGELRVYGGTFLVFSDYMRPAVRLAALMKLPVTYVWTHDSIGLGEDGPTHQPVEHLASLRAVPGLDVVRPADANETVIAWRTILERRDRPAGLCLTRQSVPTLCRSTLSPAEGAARGGYVLADSTDGRPRVVLIATGSEVHIALRAWQRLDGLGIPARLVSMPCVEWFREQDQAYRDSVLPPNVTARVSVEAGVSAPWYEWVGRDGACVSLEHFGASAPQATLYEQFGITAERVVQAAQGLLSLTAR
jgi:transketolase